MRYYYNGYNRKNKKVDINKDAKSQGKSLISNRWHKEIKEEVNDYNFKFVQAFDSRISGNKTKCDFCGSHLRYVAEIEGTHLTENSPKKEYQVGLDCLTLTLGTKWADFQQVENEIKRLKRVAQINARKEKFADKYKDLIESLHKFPESFINSNRFLRDMKRVLTTGSRSFTPNMENALRRALKRYNPDKIEKRENKIKNKIIPNLKKLLDMIRRADKILVNDLEPAPDNNPNAKTYNFVLGIYNYTVNNHYIGKYYRDKMNELWKQYKNKLENKEKEDSNDIKVLESIKEEIPY